MVGLYSAGKTVLLTSLINHLQDHDPDRFPLGSKETRLRKFTVHAPDRGLGRVQLHRLSRRARELRPMARRRPPTAPSSSASSSGSDWRSATAC